MTTHVFVGAGPANLHRALKIKKADPYAQLVIIDKRLRPTTRDIDRERARANIFRFENDVVTERLIADGVDRHALAAVTYDRDFSLERGFQHQDDQVFSDKRFTQIQIRDLQQLLLKTLDDLPVSRPLWLSENVNTNSFEATEQDVIRLLEKNHHIINDPLTDVQIHAATGALVDDEKKASIIYPDKATQFITPTTEDVNAMPVLPIHGTTTFFIKEPTTGRPLLTCDELEAAQISLDRTPWQEPLKKYGWTLVRPPRIRVFYANDVLYIGAEIPASMHEKKLDRETFEHAVTEYTRTIASLVFPNLRDEISELPVNTHLRSRFPTARGERGEVLTVTHERDALGHTVRIQQFNHGDSRYLPHYQTGSGFVTAFLQNEAFDAIYSKQSFHELYAWAQGEGLVEYNEERVHQQYETLLKADASEEKILALFKDELYMARSREIIDENKEKVGRYFNALHSQTVANMGVEFRLFLERYNAHQMCQVRGESFEGLRKDVAIMQMLKVNNAAFLRDVLPMLLNKDLSEFSDEKIFHLRNMYMDDLERNLPQSGEENIDDMKCECSERLLSPVFPHAKEILTMDELQLRGTIDKIAVDFATNTTLHHRAFVLAFFVKGKHSDTIHSFAKELRQLSRDEHLSSEQLKLNVIDVFQRFQQKLEAGESRRTLVALKTALNEHFPATEADAHARYSA